MQPLHRCWCSLLRGAAKCKVRPRVPVFYLTMRLRDCSARNDSSAPSSASVAGRSQSLPRLKEASLIWTTGTEVKRKTAQKKKPNIELNVAMKQLNLEEALQYGSQVLRWFARIHIEEHCKKCRIMTGQSRRRNFFFTSHRREKIEHPPWTANKREQK